MNILVTINPGRNSSLQYLVDADNNFEAAAIALDMFNNEGKSTAIFGIQCDKTLMLQIQVELIQELVRPSTNLNEVISVCTKLKEKRLKNKIRFFST